MKIIAPSIMLLLFLAGACRNSEGAMEDTPEDLQRVMEVMVHAAKSGDDAYLSSLARNLIIPEPEQWFRRVFGSDKGATLAEDYGAINENDIKEVFVSIAKKGQEDIKIIPVQTEEEATGLQWKAMQQMDNPARIYSVYFLKPGESRGMHLWSFAYVDKAFRLIGKLAPLEEP